MPAVPWSSGSHSVKSQNPLGGVCAITILGIAITIPILLHPNSSHLVLVICIVVGITQYQMLLIYFDLLTEILVHNMTDD